jgi:uncharacterized protein
MRDLRDAKAMAQTLRDELKAKGVSLTHSDNLGLVARGSWFPRLEHPGGQDSI